MTYDAVMEKAHPPPLLPFERAGGAKETAQLFSCFAASLAKTVKTRPFSFLTHSCNTNYVV